MTSRELHPSRRVLEQCRDTTDPELRGHVDACSRCTTMLSRMREADESYLRTYPDLASLGGPPRERATAASRARSPWRVALVAVAATTLVAVGWLIGTHSTSTLGPGRATRREVGASVDTRAKGGPSIDLLVQRSGRSFRYVDQPLHPGDVLSFRLTADRLYLLVVGIEASGKISVYLTDSSGRLSLAVPTGEPRVLDLGIELDEYLGSERFIALLSKKPLEVSAVRSALAQRFRTLAARRRPFLEVGTLPLPAEQWSWLIRKVER